MPEQMVTERCAICQLVANVDPALHKQRYGHTPEVWRDGSRFRFDFRTWTFRIPVTSGPGVHRHTEACFDKALAEYVMSPSCPVLLEEN